MTKLWNWWIAPIVQTKAEAWKRISEQSVIRAERAVPTDVGGDSLRFVAIDQEPLDEEPLFI